MGKSNTGLAVSKIWEKSAKNGNSGFERTDPPILMIQKTSYSY